MQSIFLTTCVFIATLVGAASQAFYAVTPPARAQDERELLGYIAPVLTANAMVGRVYYVSDCSPNIKYPVPIPNLKLRHPAESGTALGLVQQIIRDDDRISATSIPPNVVKIEIGNVSKTILDTKITALDLSEDQQYNPEDAIDAVDGSKLMATARTNLNLGVPLSTVDHLMNQPGHDMPHLPATISNITVDQALDLVAQTFNGVVFFGYCPSTRLYDLGFSYLERTAPTRVNRLNSEFRGHDTE